MQWIQQSTRTWITGHPCFPISLAVFSDPGKVDSWGRGTLIEHGSVYWREKGRGAKSLLPSAELHQWKEEERPFHPLQPSSLHPLLHTGPPTPGISISKTGRDGQGEREAGKICQQVKGSNLLDGFRLAAILSASQPPCHQHLRCGVNNTELPCKFIMKLP